MPRPSSLIPHAMIPRLTTDQMREVDRAMVADYGIALMQMMEQAGRHLAHLVRFRFLDSHPPERRVAVLSGTGGNGGGGFVAARRLHGWGAQVTVVTTRPDAAYAGVPAHQLAILRRLGVPVTAADQVDGLPEAELYLDALIGYSLQGAPQGAPARLIRWLHRTPRPIVSLDVPSGLDATTGEAHAPTVPATATMTLALPKTGLEAASARPYVGELYLADIGVPPALYAGPGLGLDVGPIFARDEILRLR